MIHFVVIARDSYRQNLNSSSFALDVFSEMEPMTQIYFYYWTFNCITLTFISSIAPRIMILPVSEVLGIWWSMCRSLPQPLYGWCRHNTKNKSLYEVLTNLVRTFVVIAPRNLQGHESKVKVPGSLWLICYALLRMWGNIYCHWRLRMIINNILICI